MNKTPLSVLTSFVVFTTTAGSAHETQTVGESEEQYDVIVGYAT